MQITQNTNIKQLFCNINFLSINKKPYLSQTAFDTVSFSSNKTDVVSKINQLQGNPFDNANKIKEILLEDMGLPKDCMHVELLESPKENNGYCDYFNMATGNILIHKNPKLSNQDVALIIRHELEHFMQSLGIVKHFGIDTYKNYIEQNTKEIENLFPNISTEFNHRLWTNEKLQKLFKKDKNHCLGYLNSFERRNKLDLESNSEYKKVKAQYLYAVDPGEQEAYEAQDKLAIKFGLNPKERHFTLFAEYFPQIENKINEILSKKPYCKKDITKIFQCALQKSCYNNPINEDLTNAEILKRRFIGIVTELDKFLRIPNNTK